MDEILPIEAFETRELAIDPTNARDTTATTILLPALSTAAATESQTSSRTVSTASTVTIEATTPPLPQSLSISHIPLPLRRSDAMIDITRQRLSDGDTTSAAAASPARRTANIINDANNNSDSDSSDTLALYISGGTSSPSEEEEEDLERPVLVPAKKPNKKKKKPKKNRLTNKKNNTSKKKAYATKQKSSEKKITKKKLKRMNSDHESSNDDDASVSAHDSESEHALAAIIDAESSPMNNPLLKRFVYQFNGNGNGNGNASHISLNDKELTHVPTHSQRALATKHQQPSSLIVDSLYKEVTSKYVAWRESRPVLLDMPGLTTRRATHAHFGAESARTLCRSNLRFLLGLLRLLGYEFEQISLDMFGIERVVRDIHSIMEARNTLAGRRHQLFTEMRLVIWWMADVRRIHGSRGTAASLLADPTKSKTIEAYDYLEGALLAAGSERKKEEREHLQRDVEDLEHGGKWLSNEQRLILTKRLSEYFYGPNGKGTCEKATVNEKKSRKKKKKLAAAAACGGDQHPVHNYNRLNPESPGDISLREAMSFQCHLLLHLLNDNVIPVPRSEIFCKLQLGLTFDWEEKTQQYVIEFRGDHALKNKTRTQMRILIPRQETPIFQAWIRYYRPVMLRHGIERMKKQQQEQQANVVIELGTGNNADHDSKDEKKDNDNNNNNNEPGRRSSSGGAVTVVSDDAVFSHSYLFMKKDGGAPRSEIGSATTALQKLYLGGVSATPHRFRAMQATDSWEAGISEQEATAMAAGRSHTKKAVDRYYLKHHRKRQAEVAADYLAKLRDTKKLKKHGADGDGETTTDDSNNDIDDDDGDDDEATETDKEEEEEDDDVILIPTNLKKAKQRPAKKAIVNKKKKKKKKQQQNVQANNSSGTGDTQVPAAVKKRSSKKSISTKQPQQRPSTQAPTTLLDNIDWGE